MAKKKVIKKQSFKDVFYKETKYKERKYLRCSEGFLDATGLPGPMINNINMFLGHSDTGKAQPLSSKILTPNGYKLMGDIQIGDEIVGSDGNSQYVIGVYPQGVRPVYKVTLKDGATVYCDEEHLWSVNEYKDRHKGTKDKDGIKRYTPDNSFKTMKLKDMINNVKVKTGEYSSCNYKLPTLSPVNFKNVSNLPIDPYVLGCFIGDGSFGNNNDVSKITTKDPEIINEISKTKHFRVSHNRTRVISEGDIEVTREINSISLTNETRHSLKSLGLTGHSHTKYIPKNYIYSSTIDDRINLLQGLMDTDGYVDKRSGTAYYTTTSERLCNDVIELVNSLGGKTKCSSKIPTYTYKGTKKKGRLAYNISIKLSGITPFKLSRKVENYVDNSNTSRYIENIEFSHYEECQCIKVSNTDRLYVTDNYVLTHNTTALIESMVASQKNGGFPVLFITEGKWDFSHAKEMGFEAEEIVDEETGEVTWDGDFLFFDGFDYVEQIIDKINELFDYQEKNDDAPKKLDIFWDSIGSIPCKMSYEGKGGTQHTARVLSETIGMGLHRRITKCKKANVPYDRTLVIVNQPWVDVDMSSPMSQPEIKPKGGNAVYLASTLVFLFGNQRSGKTSKLVATKNNRRYVYARRTKISILKNHDNGSGFEDGKVFITAHGFIKIGPKSNEKKYIDEYKDLQSEFIRSKLGIDSTQNVDFVDEDESIINKLKRKKSEDDSTNE